MPPRNSVQLTEEELADFKKWVEAGKPNAGDTTKGGLLRAFEALTHLSVHRDRLPGDRAAEAGADLVRRGEKVMLDGERAERLLSLGAIRPWKEKEAGAPAPQLTARDMSGKTFPDQNQGPAADPTGQAEATDVQPPAIKPEDTQPASQVTDPYAK